MSRPHHPRPGSVSRTAALSAVALTGCSLAFAALGMPPNPTRPGAPPGIERTALAVGARAPEIRLPSSLGGEWSLAAALRDGPAVLVFYRGDW